LNDIWLSQLRAFFDTRVNDLETSADELAINGYKACGPSSYWTEHMRQILLDDIATKLQLHSRHRVLDVGCGTGMILRHIAPKVAHITGVDFSAEMIRLAQLNAPANATLRLGSADTLDFRDETFDRVLCYNVILNFQDDNFTRSVIEELVRVTRSGGLVLIGYVPDQDKQEEQAQIVRQLRQPGTHTNAPQSLLSRVIYRAHTFSRYRVQPRLFNRFYSKAFFIRFAEQASCRIEILPMNVEGFPFAPFRYDVRLWPY
jgi:ubiquinone/menaquinone biosynthesis C-methylase UbiE